MSKILIAIFAAIISFSSFAIAQQRTDVNNAASARMLLGRHRLSLQWISWDYFGLATVVANRRGQYLINASQQGRGKNRTDFVSIDGVITSIDAKQFVFQGKIVTKVSHINRGNQCIREGKYTFEITGKRKYWRLQEMDNPCDPVTDYVDIYFR